MTEKTETGYCPSCGKTVKVFALLAEGNVVHRCMQCGMEVEPRGTTNQKDEDVELSPPSQSPQPAPQPPKARQAQKQVPKAEKPPAPPVSAPPQEAAPHGRGKQLKYVMIAEDSKLLSAMINDVLIEGGFAEKVTTSLDGDEFIQKFTEAMISNNPPSLIILDINLPAIDGTNICVAIRAVEKAFGATKLRPIIFFTAKEIDSHLKKLIDTYQPARYINKGTESDPAKMADRIRMVMETLLK